MQVSDYGTFVEDFQLAAQIEGRDPTVREATILLNEAIGAGWP